MRARRTLSIRHGIKDPMTRMPKKKGEVMVVKGPAGGFTAAYPRSSQSPSEFFKK
jgi:hypothetical protein